MEPTCSCTDKRRLQNGSQSHLSHLEMLRSGLAASGVLKQGRAKGAKHCLPGGFRMTWRVSAWPCHVSSVCTWQPFGPFLLTAFQPCCRWSATHCCFVLVQRKAAGCLVAERNAPSNQILLLEKCSYWFTFFLLFFFWLGDI